MLQECPVKGADGGKTAGMSHIGDGCFFCQQAAGILYPKAVDEVLVADIHAFLKNMGYIIFVQVEVLRQNIQCKGLGVVFGAVGQQTFDIVLAGRCIDQGHLREELAQQGE